MPEDEGRKYIQEISFNPYHWYLRQYLANWPLVRAGMRIEDVARLIPFVPVEPPNMSSTSWRGIDLEGDEIIDGPFGRFSFWSARLRYHLLFNNGILTEKTAGDYTARSLTRPCS